MFKITIEEIKDVVCDPPAEYKVTGEIRLNATELEKIDYNGQKEYKHVGEGIFTKPIYSYVQPPARAKEITTKIFEQQIATINLSNVIKALNGLS